MFLPALAAHTARLDPLVTGRGYRNDGRWPWAAAAMARESVLFSNEFRHGGIPTENDFAKLYNLFNATYDLEDDPSIADIMIPLVYEQFGYWESEFEELARVWALFGDPTLGRPIAWADVFGMELEKAARAALVLHGFAVHNGGHIDAALLDAPHMQDIFTKVAPRQELEALMRYFTVTVEGARDLGRLAPAVASNRQRYAFNPFVAKPLIDLGRRGVWAPQSLLVSRAIFPTNLYYVGMRQWGTPFAENLGTRVEQYVGRQLRLTGGDHVEGEITYGKGDKSVDWIWVTDACVILVECKSARMTFGAKAADSSLGTIVSRSIGKARTQIDRTAQLINERHPAFRHIPADRPIVGMVVTAEPFYLGNAGFMPEYGPPSKTPSQVVSLRELEDFVCLDEAAAADLLQRTLEDPEKRTWAMANVMQDLGDLGKNPLLADAWKRFDFLDPTDTDAIA